MRLLWLSNMAPAPVLSAMGQKNRGGLWIDHVLEDLRKDPEIRLHLLCPWDSLAEGKLDDSCSYTLFQREVPTAVSAGQQELFLKVIRKFRPHVIHVWGTEYGHTLAMLRACRQEGLLDHTVVSIQGLCSIYARHYNEGIPAEILRKSTFRDFLRQDNLLQQQKVFEARGKNEEEALRICRHVIGRTDWDRACVRWIHPEAKYHFCNETLRTTFYQGKWTYAHCIPHRIFASSRIYPIKGFHYLLEALAEVRKRYPDAVLAVPGDDPAAKDLKARLHQDGYGAYLQSLTEKYGLQDAVSYLGSLSGEEMKENYLKANVFVLPSTIENSPNSMGEAMLLGVPVAAADVGGVTNMLTPGKEGLVYQSTAPYMLAYAIEQIFAMEDQAERLGSAAAEHAKKTHNPEENLRTLLGIYRELQKKEA